MMFAADRSLLIVALIDTLHALMLHLTPSFTHLGIFLSSSQIRPPLPTHPENKQDRKRGLPTLPATYPLCTCGFPTGKKRSKRSLPCGRSTTYLTHYLFHPSPASFHDLHDRQIAPNGIDYGADPA